MITEFERIRIALREAILLGKPISHFRVLQEQIWRARELCLIDMGHQSYLNALLFDIISFENESVERECGE